MYLIGNIALILGIVISLYSLAANIVGLKRKDRRWLESARGGIMSLAFVTSIVLEEKENPKKKEHVINGYSLLRKNKSEK
ncbi:hypothetical protein KHA94_16060 [Bacillus sp. FJAT-49705]|uniref:Uncharacterized protein n=1 Tax=Cytobacillus citreus TaxID=2833586 RepID=A0ABS5NVT2_9BACI|nr:hypothetical protein [Cytobacillus citreus]MBS4191706.1 hypothetical protein [Cytobacillus citreus]